MKKIITGVFLCLISGFSFSQDALPKFYDNISIIGIEAWPDAGNPTYGYMVKMAQPLSNTGCGSSSAFSVKAGEFQDVALSLLLTALTTEKEIRIRVVECSDRALVDRVELKK